MLTTQYHSPISRFSFIVLFMFLGCISILLSISLGSVNLSFAEIFLNLSTHYTTHEIIFNLRIPETLTAFITGSLLGLAGALMQILLRNPLADPYILGTSSGAGLITFILMSLGIEGLILTVGAWIGSILAIFFILLLTRKKLAFHSDHLILTGVGLSSGLAALMSLILLCSQDHLIRSMLFWLVGDLSDATMPYGGIIILISGLLFSLMLSDELNILTRGEKEALALGVNVRRLKIILLLLTGVLTGEAVTLAGCIGFIGLIVPHVARFIFGYDHRLLLPMSALIGGIFLTLADTISRVIISPAALPVGIVMTLIGIPVFLFLLQRSVHNYSDKIKPVSCNK